MRFCPLLLRTPFLRNPSSFRLHYRSQRRSANHHSVHDVVSQFHRMIRMHPLPSVYAFGKVIGSLVRMEANNIVISCFKKMEHKGIRCDLLIHSTVLNCFCKLGEMPFSFCIFAKILKRGYHPDSVILTNLMRGFCDNGEVEKALHLYNKAIAEGFRFDEYTYGTLINGLCKKGETEAAIKLLRMVEGTLHTSNVRRMSPLWRMSWKILKNTDAAA